MRIYHEDFKCQEDQWDPEETTLDALLARPNVPEQAKDNLRLYFAGDF